MRNLRVLIAESTGFSKKAIQILTNAGFQLRLADLDRFGLINAIPACDIVWVRLRTRLDAEIMDASPALIAIATATTGLTHIDMDAARNRGIRVISLTGEVSFLESVHATAEHTIALMLTLLRKLLEATRHATKGGWNRDLYRGRELYGKSVGLIGIGRVGRQVAALLTAFGATVAAADPFTRESPVPLMPLYDLLKWSDIVSLHIALNATTHRLLGRSEFMHMKPSAYLVNTSRGEVIDEPALLEALQEHRIAGAALDVISSEHTLSSSNNPLVDYASSNPNLILTPHIGGCTWESIEMTETFLAQKLCRLYAPTGVAS